MHLLVLGGTVFLGRHVVEAARAQGHEVTLFHRGRHEVEGWPDVRRLRGDRNGELSALKGRRFDAVIDCSGYTPVQTEATARLLADTPAYVFVSSISVLAAFPPGQACDEASAVTADTEGYGGAKARAEEALQAHWKGTLACVRPGLIVGPHDPTGRFTHWPLRVSLGGEVLAPGRPQRPVQFIDVRDLAAFCLKLAVDRMEGTFHAVGDSLPMSQLLDTCRAVAHSDAAFVWASDEALLRCGATPWSALPLWIPEGDPTHGGMLLCRNDRARDAGLGMRPCADTVAATLEWAQRTGARLGEKAGLSLDDEAALRERLRATEG